MISYAKYFAISEQDREWGLYALNCGASLLKPSNTFPTTDHPLDYRLTWSRGRVLHEYQLIYLVEGKGVFEGRKCGELPLQAGDVVLVEPEKWHRYKPLPGHAWQTYWVGFQGLMAERLMQQLPFTAENPRLHVGHQPELLRIYESILADSQLELAGYQQVLSGDILKLMGWLHALERRASFEHTQAESTIQAAKVMLMQDDLNLSMEEVAAEVNLGYSSFRKLFRDYTGLAPGQYHLQHKLNKATALLHEGSMTVKQIAYALRFESPQYFARLFRKKMGLSPTDYRKRLEREKSKAKRVGGSNQKNTSQ